MWISKKRFEKIINSNNDLENRVNRLQNSIDELLLKTARFEVGDIVSRLYYSGGWTGWDLVTKKTELKKDVGYKIIKMYVVERNGERAVRYTIIKDTTLLETDECLLVKEVKNEQRTDI